MEKEVGLVGSCKDLARSLVSVNHANGASFDALFYVIFSPLVLQRDAVVGRA